MTTLCRTSLRFSVLGILLAAGSASAAEATVDRDAKHQIIEGFGFFGAHDVWWGSERDMVDEQWVRLVIEDLGITMWRNEYYPPGDSISGQQDADWDKQRPVVELFKEVADERKVPLKFLLTVWSPPASMKCEVVDDAILEGSPHPDGTKGGGALCPSRRGEFADWLIDGLELHADLGVDVYALSFQNEPFFWQSYNSCFYAQDWYAETLAEIGPTIKAAFPDVKLFGAENMLEIECGRSDAGEFDPWWYTGLMLDRSDALAEVDAWAVHGYSDGVNATPTSKMARLWSEFSGAVQATNKPVWMTETSGYEDSWEGGELPGAIDLAQSIYAALRYGNLSAWVWWQGSELGSGPPGEYALMNGTEVLGKRYYVSKNFYRYVRPGARRVDVSSDDDEVLVVGFEHPGMGSFTVVAINVSEQEQPLTISGPGVPETFDLFRSSSDADCAEFGSVSADGIRLPPRSVTTLVHGNVYEDRASGGIGGAGGTGGDEPGTGGSDPGASGQGPGAAGETGLGGDPSAAGREPGTGGRGTGGAPANLGGAEVSTGGRPPTTGGREPAQAGSDAESGGTAPRDTGGVSAGGRATGGSATGGQRDVPTGGTTGGVGESAGSDSGAYDNDDTGCRCAVPGHRDGRHPWATLLGAFGLALSFARRRRGRVPSRS